MTLEVAREELPVGDPRRVDPDPFHPSVVQVLSELFGGVAEEEPAEGHGQGHGARRGPGHNVDHRPQRSPVTLRWEALE